MKKNLIIIILSIITITSLIFGFSQKQRAVKQEALAKEYSEALLKKERQEEIARDLAKKYQKKAIVETQRLKKEAKLAQEKSL